jgi:hypothetical protein
MHENELDQWLKESLRVPDQGFSNQLMARLPAQKSARPWSMGAVLPLVFAMVATLVAVQSSSSLIAMALAALGVAAADLPQIFFDESDASA